MELTEETPYRSRIEPSGRMRVPGVVFASRALLASGVDERALHQVANVATLPGIVDASYAMPDFHLGYGFPIGGVCATDVADGGVVSPGGVGFDICCGIRLYAASLSKSELTTALPRLMDELGRVIPRGAGTGAVWKGLSRRDLEQVLLGGSAYAVQRGHGVQRDLYRCEDGGAVQDADPGQVGDKALQRGLEQLGSLGSGNHFLEVQAVDRVLDPVAAAAFGLEPDQICVMIHCGSRGLGHQVCTDQVRVVQTVMPRYGIDVPDRQLACAPVDSEEGRRYLGAMAASANYARANRQLLGEATRRVFAGIVGAELDLVYDVAHNLAKLETHQGRQLCVHRKGATRALPPGHPDIPHDLSTIGQPVLIPGSMGTSSYVLAGMDDAPAFASTCHGAGRALSRHQAVRRMRGRSAQDEMNAQGIQVRGAGWKGLAEEMPEAYKDVDEVIASATGAGLARPVARLVPIGVVKG